MLGAPFARAALMTALNWRESDGVLPRYDLDASYVARFRNLERPFDG
jgi:hypothetical protein